MRFSILATLVFLSFASLTNAASVVGTTCAFVGEICSTSYSGNSGTCEASSAGPLFCNTNTNVGSGGIGTPPAGEGSGGVGQPPSNAPGPDITLINPLKGVDCSSGNGNCLAAFLLNIMDFVIQIGTIIVILILVFVGYKFVVAQGAPGEIEEAKKMLLWTLIGALVLLGAKAISAGLLATVQALGG